jgi:hypothetical protein
MGGDDSRARRNKDADFTTVGTPFEAQGKEDTEKKGQK